LQIIPASLTFSSPQALHATIFEDFSLFFSRKSAPLSYCFTAPVPDLLGASRTPPVLMCM
jgi:hypothetical protein